MYCDSRCFIYDVNFYFFLLLNCQLIIIIVCERGGGIYRNEMESGFICII